MTSNRRRHAEIAGGGIAGLTAAIALAQRQWTVRVHERSPAIRPEGAGIYIWENGLRVLTAIGAYDEAVAGCHQGWMRETRDEGNRAVAIARWSAEPGRRVVSVARLRLLGALFRRAQALGVEIVFSREAVAARPDGEILLHDGARRKADLIVAADGINSKIRDSLGLLRSRKRHADGAIRVMIPRTAAERVAEDGRKYIEYWSGFRRVLYTPCSADELYLALTTLDRDEDGKRLPLDKKVWTRSFPHLAALIDRIGEGARWDCFETVKLAQWSSGRVAIIGDAAHAQAPNLGQGGGCSLMNALALAVSLDETGSVEHALQLWERRERPLTDHTQRVSALYSKVTTWPPLLRSVTLNLLGKSRWAMAQRMRTAFHVPTGTAG
ncbi:MAG: FAD-dependent oxidoreductase [Alphaproteobacteria bacterium]